MTQNFTSETFASTYRDDYADSDSYYRILFRGRKYLQQRELNQLQTILHQQIKRMSDNLYKQGAAVNPGQIVVNNAYEFIKLASGTSLPSDTSVLVGQTFVGQTSGVEAKVLEVVAATPTDPATLYVAYTNTASATAGSSSVRMSAGEVITDGTYTYSVQTTNTTTNPAVGLGTQVYVGSGNFYALGYHVFVSSQSIIFDKYSRYGTGEIGFLVSQDIVTEDDTDALYDNSNATPNKTMPGAHRYRIRLTLKNADEVDSDDVFIYAAKIISGDVVDRAEAQNDYNVINDLLATRTREESGNYIAKPFLLTTKENDSDNTKLDLKISDGVAYINGYRAVVTYPTRHIVDRPRATQLVENQNIATSYGNYVKSDTGLGLRETDTLALVNLRDSDSYQGSTIGTARVRAYDNENSLANGVRYYLFDIQMNSGSSFRNVKSFGTGVTDYANIYQEAGKSVLYETGDNNLLFPLPKTRPQSLSDISYTAQRKFDATTDSSGSATINLSATGETFTNTSDWIFANADSDVVTGLSVSGNGTQGATITGAPINSSNFEIYAYVNKANASVKTKTLNETTVTGAIESDGSGTIFLDLGRADIYDVSRIRADDSDGENLWNRFRLDNGQRDNFYALGRLILKGGYTAPAGNVFARFRYFSHSTSGDFFAVNSYSGQVDYEDIPSHRLNNGTLIQLRDAIDFRPVQNTSGSYSGGAARIPELPEPSTSVTSDVTYYLPRTDAVVIDETGVLRVLEGKASFKPIVPDVPQTALKLYDVEYNPYVLNDSDLVVSRKRHKRFTMADIARLEQRVADVEEVVSLSLLELDTINLDVLDSDGNNRLKAGFVADNFKDFFFTDLETPELRSALNIQLKEMVPEVKMNSIRLVYDSDASTNTVLKGDNVYMKYDPSTYIDQPKASGTLNLNPYDIQQTVGRVTLSPSTDYWLDTNKLADKIIEKEENRTVTQTVTRYSGGGAYDYQHENYSYNGSNNEGQGGGNGGGKVICGELYRQRLIPRDIYAADLKYQKLFVSDVEKAAYLAWATPYARLMKKSKLATYAVLPFARAWAYEMAYRMDKYHKSTLMGRIIVDGMGGLHRLIGRLAYRKQGQKA
jgi:hypothetical protein